MGIQLNSSWDLAVENCNGQLTLVVEVKRKTHASPQWAAQLRRNIFAHGTFPKAPYFLMVFPDQFYLWSDTQAYQEESEPTYMISATPILKPYLERAGLTADRISADSLVLIIISWLGELMHSQKLPESLQVSQPWIVHSGLYPALVGGKFQDEKVA